MDSNLEWLDEARLDNCWDYDSKRLVLIYESYEVDLKRILTSTEALDWIVQVSQKMWGTPKVVGDLVRLLDAILDFQGNYCSGGQEHGPVDAAQLIQRRFEKHTGPF